MPELDLKLIIDVQGLVHISTAYCNTDTYHVSEEIRKQPMDPRALVELCSVTRNTG